MAAKFFFRITRAQKLWTRVQKNAHNLKTKRFGPKIEHSKKFRPLLNNKFGITISHLPRMRTTQETHCSPVKSSLESQDGQIWWSWSLVIHGGSKFLLCEICSSSTLMVHVMLEHQLDPILIGTCATHHGIDLVQALRCHGHEELSHFYCPIFCREPA